MSQAGKRHSALVAERDREARAVIAAVLQESFDVDSLEFGDDVFRRIRDETPDVLLLGSPLYVEVGAMRRLLVQELIWRGLHEMLRRTIILTPHTRDREFLTRVRSAGVFAVIAKPFDVQSVPEIAQACVARPANHTTLWVGIDEPPNVSRTKKTLEAE